MSTSYALAETTNLPGAYEPRGAAKQLWSCKDPQVIIEGPSETGKTLGCLHKLDALAWKYPGMQGVIVRKTMRSAASSVLQTYAGKVLGQMARVTGDTHTYKSGVEVYGGNKPEMYIYPNGSQVWVGGMDNPDKVLSSERDLIYVNQAEELSLVEWEILTTRVTGRAGNVPFPQMIGDCNPGAPTHWILSKAREGSLTLLHSTHKDNPTLWDTERGEWTEQGQRTLAILGKLTGARKDRLLTGLWVTGEGSIFETFTEERHKVHSFIPPSIWPRVVGLDPTGAYVGAVWGAYDPGSNVLHIYREYLQPYGLTTSKNAENIRALSRGETIWGWFGGGPSERQERLDFSTALGVELKMPPPIGVWPGIDKVSQLLSDGGLVVHDCCTGLLSEIGSYARVTNRNGEQTEKIADKESYHLIDCLRYLIVGTLGPQEQVQSEFVYIPTSIGVYY